MRTDSSVLCLRTDNDLLDDHIDSHFPCHRCNLYKTAFRYVAFRGTLPAQVLFIGEAPGHTENVIGRPFVGRAGDILDCLIKNSIRKTSYYTYGITNVICCLPVNPDDIHHFRKPGSHEMAACRPRLLDITRKCDPKLIVLLGKVAEKGFPIQDVEPPCIPLQHPAYILRKGGVGTKEYDHNLSSLVEGLKTYVKKKKKQLKKEDKSRGNKKQAKRNLSTERKKKIKKRTRKK